MKLLSEKQSTKFVISSAQTTTKV